MTSSDIIVLFFYLESEISLAFVQLLEVVVYDLAYLFVGDTACFFQKHFFADLLGGRRCIIFEIFLKSHQGIGLAAVGNLS